MLVRKKEYELTHGRALLPSNFLMEQWLLGLVRKTSDVFLALEAFEDAGVTFEHRHRVLF
jgi:hypothetical protein